MNMTDEILNSFTDYDQNQDERIDKIIRAFVVLSNTGFNKNKIKIRATAAETISGVTFTPNADGTISTTGTATNDVWYTLSSADDMASNTISGEDYYLSGCPDGGSNTTYMIVWNNSGIDYASLDSRTSVRIQKQSTYDKMMIGVRKGVNSNGLVFKPMLRYADFTDNVFVPYKA